MQTKRRGKLVKNWTTIRLNGGSTKPSVRCACGHQPTASTDDVMQRRERNLYRMFIGAARPQMSVSRRRLAGARLTDGWRQPPTQPARPPASLPAVYMPAVDQSLLTAVVVEGSPAGRPAGRGAEQHVWPRRWSRVYLSIDSPTSASLSCSCCCCG